MLQKVDVVVFDFDGTLSASDSCFEFGKYCFKHSLSAWLYLPVIGIGYVARMLNPNGIWWRRAIRFFIKSKHVKELTTQFIKHHKNLRFGWAKEQVAKEHRQGNKVVLISAGPDYLIPYLVADMKFDAVITSKQNKEKPWNYDFLCWGPNKVVALDNWAKENKYIPNVIRSYSDSKSDLPIMNVAKEQIWIDSKTGMRKN